MAFFLQDCFLAHPVHCNLWNSYCRRLVCWNMWHKNNRFGQAK